jgi:hypothetical protein
MTTPVARAARRSLRLAAAAVLAAAIAVALAIPASSGAAGPARAEATEPVAPNRVAVPYLGEIEVKPAEGYTFQNCDAVLAASELATACVADTLTFAAPVFDPEFGTERLPVRLASGSTSLEIDYLVTMAPPATPALADMAYGYPFRQGSRVMIPLSELGITCGLCDEGANVEVTRVRPKAAGTPSVTSTHLVLAADPDFLGSADLRVRVTDDIGQRSKAADVRVSLVPGSPGAVRAQHVVMPLEGDRVEVDLTQLVSGDGVSILSCGAPIVGAVLCDESGAATFSLPSGASPGADQFAFHAIDASGRQATGSVTLVAPDAESGDAAADADAEAAPEAGTEPPAVRLAPGSGAKLATAIVPTREPEAAAAGGGGGKTAITRLLDPSRA